MSENYIYAMEVGTEEVPIKLNHTLTTSPSGKPVYLKSNGDVFTIYDADSEYLTIDPSGQTVGGGGSTGHFFMAEGPGGAIGIASNSVKLENVSDRYVEVADDLITMANESSYFEVGNDSICGNISTGRF